MEDYKDVHIKIFLKAGLIGDWMGWKDVSFPVAEISEMKTNETHPKPHMDRRSYFQVNNSMGDICNSRLLNAQKHILENCCHIC